MIRLGVNVPNFGPGVDARALLGWARFAEDNGFTTLVMSDHVAPTPDVTELYPPPFYDALTMCAWLAARTTTLRLGTSVLVVPYRHPLVTARIGAMLHELSDARFVLGVGVGWSRPEFEALGADFDDRGPTTDRYLEVITAAWARDRVSADLPGLALADVATGPTPGPGAVPLWIGGSARAAVRRAVRFGTAWHPINPDGAWLRDTGLPALRQESDRQGVPAPAVVPRIKCRLSPRPAPADRPLGVGSAEQVVDDVRFLVGLGAEQVVLDPNPDTPRARDTAREQADLLRVRSALP